MTALLTSPTNLRDAKKLGLPDVAFIGKAGAGKSSAADWACEVAGYMRWSFATPLKNIAEHLWGTDARKDRDKLQRLGVAVREIQKDTWCTLLVDDLELASGPVAVDDCRFPNEYWALKSAGFKFIRITAEQDDRLDRLKLIGKDTTPEQLEHVSETSLDDFAADYTIRNEDDKVSFLERVSNALITVSR